MPVYMFTYHAYGSWMPDRRRGYVRDKEILPPDGKAARQYRKNMKHSPVEFDDDIQRFCIDEVIRSSERQRFRAYFIATDLTHIHVVVSWRDSRPWKTLRAGIRRSMTMRLNREIERRP